MPTDILFPETGESITTGVLATWSKAKGEWIERDETVAEIETDKITVEVPAPTSGVIGEQMFAEGDEIEVGSVIGTIDESASKPDAGDAPAKADASSQAETSNPQAAPKARVETEPAEPASDDESDVRATPLARKVAKEHGLDLAGLPGTGAGGRVREQDVLEAVKNRQSSTATAAAPSPSPVSGARGKHVERLSPLRLRVASRLVEAQHTAAMLTTFNECDMTAVMALRKQYKEQFEKQHSIGLGFMSFFVKAAVSALRAFPLVNAYIVDNEGTLAVEHHDYCDVAIAVASNKGLVVPVLRNAESMSFADVELSVKDLASKAQDGKLTLDEMTGGTFTITNGGIFGSLNSTPILNPPQSAILGMHSIKKRPVEDPDNPGQIALRPMMNLALSYDHRLIDGAQAVRFLVKIKESIEDPQRLMLGI